MLYTAHSRYHYSRYYRYPLTLSSSDPFVQCNLNPCLQSPCGINADCSATGQVTADTTNIDHKNIYITNHMPPPQRAVCKCRPNYVGDPFSECRLEPCSTSPCGVNADCTASGR